MQTQSLRGSLVLACLKQTWQTSLPLMAPELTFKWKFKEYENGVI